MLSFVFNKNISLNRKLLIKQEKYGNIIMFNSKNSIALQLWKAKKF